MVSRGVSDDAFGSLGVAEGEDGVDGAAELERAALLEHLALEVQLDIDVTTTDEGVQRRAGVYRGHLGYRVTLRTHAPKVSC